MLIKDFITVSYAKKTIVKIVTLHESNKGKCQCSISRDSQISIHIRIQKVCLNLTLSTIAYRQLGFIVGIQRVLEQTREQLLLARYSNHLYSLR